MMNDVDHQPYQQDVQNLYRVLDQPNVVNDVIPINELLPISLPIQMVPVNGKNRVQNIIIANPLFFKSISVEIYMKSKTECNARV